MKDEKLLPIRSYLKVWGVVLVLITFSYVIFLLQIEPLWLRRFLFIAIALVQAALSLNYFMQLRLERPSLVYAVLLPVTLLISLIVFATGEGSYVTGVRQLFFGPQTATIETIEGKKEVPPQEKPVVTEDPVEKGKQLAQANGCLSCHSVTGAPMVGPTWKGLYGQTVELQDGTTVTADEAYLRESIVTPTAKIVKGFPPAMPSFSQLSDEQIQALIAYIKSLSAGTEGK